MIVDFRFENFRSYRREARLRMMELGTVNRIAAIYGPNASGKTTVVHALAIMRGIVLGSVSMNSTDTLPFQPFLLSKDNENDQEGLFEITYSLMTGSVFRYGFSLNRNEITSEWLFGYRDLQECVAGEGEGLFIRDGRECGGTYQKAKDVFPRTLPNMLLIAKLDQDNDKMAHDILGWFRNLVIIQAYSDDRLYAYSHKQVMKGPYRGKIMDLMRFADPTIVNVHEVMADWTEIENPELRQRLRRNAFAHGLRPARIEFIRRTSDNGETFVALPFDETESAGTQKMFCLSGPLADIFENGYTMVVDEIDSKFHPALTQKLVSMFADSSVNEKSAQLIVTTHDVELMRCGILKPAQVFFCEKNMFGESSLYSLAQFRNSERFTSQEMAEKYLEGIFGAMPSFDTESEEFVHE